MATAEKLREAAQEAEIKQLREEIGKGSPWSALVLAVKLRPISAGELARSAHVQHLAGTRKQKAFDACVDAYTVFEDARRRSAI